MAKGLSAAKAKRILQDGYVKGKPLTAKQRKYFGAIASGGTPLKAINGNWLDKFAMGGSLPGASGMMYSRNSGSSAMSPPNLTKAQDGFYKDIPEEVLKKESNFYKGFYKDTDSQGEGTPVPGSPGLINFDTVEYGTPEYKKAYDEGTFADVIEDKVTKAFKALRFAHAEMEAELLLNSLNGMLLAMLLNKQYEIEPLLNLMLKKYQLNKRNLN